MKRLIPVMVILLVSAFAVPMALQEAALHHVRNSLFAAVRFAALADPAQLSQLPVSHWTETAGVQPQGLYQRGWQQYRMQVPRADTTVIADIDLRPISGALLLGAGGWLRVAVCLLLGTVAAGWVLRPRTFVRTSRQMQAPDKTEHKTQKMVSIHFLQESLNQTSAPALVLDHHHQLQVWNAAMADQLPDMHWQRGMHLLDFALNLPWGAQLMEVIDTASVETHVMVIRKGESLCVL